MNDQNNSHDLASIIERKDHLFRIAQGVFMVTATIGILILFFVQIRTQEAVREQLRQQQVLIKQQQDLIKEIQVTSDKQDKLREEQLNRVNRHLDCIVIFFQQADRANLTIEDINECTLNNLADEEPSFQQPLVSGGTREQEYATTPSPTQSPTAEPSATYQPSSTTNGSGSQVSSPTPSPTPPEPEPQPSLLDSITQPIIKAIGEIL